MQEQEAIKEAREAYDALSETDKAQFDNNALYYLIKDEAVLAKLKAEKSE